MLIPIRPSTYKGALARNSREEQNTDHFDDNGQDDAGDICEASEDESDWENYLNRLNGLEASVNGEQDYLL
jgi:hypothetical protein